MKVEASQVTEIQISDIKPGEGEYGKLDPIMVTLKNYRPGCGELTIKCFQEVWTAGWGAMGDQSVEQFFVDSDTSYLISNLSRGMRSVQPVADPDWEPILKERVIAARRHDGGCYLGREAARELWDEIHTLALMRQLDPEHDTRSREIACELLGGDWYSDWPTEPNPKYYYLERIVLAVQAGLKQWMESQDTLSNSCEPSASS